MSVAERLADLGLTLPAVVPPVAAYVPAKVHGDLVYTAGQLPFVEGALPATGKVGQGEGLVAAADAQRYARQCALNAVAAAADAAGGLERLSGVLKVTGFVASVPEFTGQPGVINGASELLGELFGDTHARSAVGVPVLPLDSPVEVEVVFTLA